MLSEGPSLTSGVVEVVYVEPYGIEEKSCDHGGSVEVFTRVVLEVQLLLRAFLPRTSRLISRTKALF